MSKVPPIEKQQLEDLIATAVTNADAEEAYKWAAVWDAFFRYDDDNGTVPIYSLPHPTSLRELEEKCREMLERRHSAYDGADEALSQLGYLADRIEETLVTRIDKNQAHGVKQILKQLDRAGVPKDQQADEIVRILDSHVRG